MEYDVNIRVQGVPTGDEEMPALTVYTQGHLEVERGKCELQYVQYEGDVDFPVLTRISLNRDSVSLERSDHTTMVFDRRRPSFHPVRTQSGRTISMMIVPQKVEWNQRKGKGSLRLAYDLVYEGRITSNHDIYFEFFPA